MKCPKCGSHNVRVCMTKSTEAGVSVRRRNCLGCGHRWYSAQEPEYLVQRGRDFTFYGRGHGEKILLLQNGKKEPLPDPWFSKEEAVA